MINYIKIYFKFNKNNLFVIVTYNKMIKLYSLGQLNIKNKQLIYVCEILFNKIINILLLWQITNLLLFSNKRIFLKKKLISLLSKNFNHYNINILKYQYIDNIKHNGCRLNQ